MTEDPSAAGSKAKLADVEDYLSGLKERERRTIVRKIQRGDLIIQKTADGVTLTEVEQRKAEERDMEVDEDDRKE